SSSPIRRAASFRTCCGSSSRNHSRRTGHGRHRGTGENSQQFLLRDSVPPWPVRMLTSQAIKQRAAELNFDLCGVAPAAAFPELRNLEQWLARGYAGEMDYMQRSAHVRADIRNFLPS